MTGPRCVYVVCVPGREEFDDTTAVKVKGLKGAEGCVSRCAKVDTETTACMSAAHFMKNGKC